VSRAFGQTIDLVIPPLKLRRRTANAGSGNCYSPVKCWFCTRVAQFAEVQRILVQIRTQMRTDVSVKIPQGVEVVSSVVNAPSTSVVFLNSRRCGISESKSSVHIYEPTTRLPIHCAGPRRHDHRSARVPIAARRSNFTFRRWRRAVRAPIDGI
jgi:hypothetical protein